MIESATDEDREKLQEQYDVLDAEVKKLEGVRGRKSLAVETMCCRWYDI
ncbi:MAG: hypothetical protein LBK82_05440 [Planctomycetaceae bacterium]|nr:hypothetical protein [Planctomycetaceae bacterium]